jgi:integrase
MNAMLKLNPAKQKVSRKEGESVKGVFTRNDILYVRKRVNGVLYTYSTGKKDDELNRSWVEYHSEQIWQEKHSASKKEKKASSEPTIKEFGLTYYAICPDTREQDTNDRLLNDFNKYIVPLLGDIKVSELTPTDIEQWQEKIKYYPDPVPNVLDIQKVEPRRGASRLKNIRNALTQVIDRAVADGVREPLVIPKMKYKKKAPKRKIISIKEAEMMDYDELEDIFTDDTVTFKEEEILHLIDLCDEKIEQTRASHFRFVWKSFKCLMIFKFYSGVRSGEAIALMWDNVDFENNKVKIKFTMKRGGSLKLPKENKVREIELLPEAKDALLAARDLSNHKKWVFLNKNREPYKATDSVDKLWKQLLKIGNYKKARFYNTRHSFITNMLSRNLNSEWLIQQVGHEDIVITRMKYMGKISPESDKLYNSLENKVVYQ